MDLCVLEREQYGPNSTSGDSTSFMFLLCRKFPNFLSLLKSLPPSQGSSASDPSFLSYMPVSLWMHQTPYHPLTISGPFTTEQVTLVPSTPT